MLSTASVKTIIFRSLYHCDAHEKIAKLFGIWIHGCVDGYSRYIVYLRAATDKKSQTVEDIFVDACNGWPNGFGVGTPEQTGWASRVRVDKGTENVGLMLRQVERHYDPATTFVAAAFVAKKTYMAMVVASQQRCTWILS